jgi:TRAP-type C4-dicarboxylate transport system permease small subunit
LKDTGSLFPDYPALRLLDKAERAILCLLLLAMIFLACAQIVLRTFFLSGLPWADPLLRYLVLWSGLLGAVSATSQGKHIALDITGNRLPKENESWITLITNFFCTLAAGGLTWAGWLFCRSELEFRGEGPLSLQLWFWNSIFPAAYGLIALKYLLLLIMQVRRLLGATHRPDGSRP